MSSDNLIAELNNISIMYPLNIYKNSNSLRDLFIDALHSPVDFFIKEKEYFKALDQVNLSIFQNDIIGIVGRNGSGKTTLCKCLSGLIFPSNGKICKKGKIHSIFDVSVVVMPNLTGRENAFLLAKLYFPDLSKHEILSIVEEAIEFSDLGSFIDIPYKNYSKGMQARICLSVISARPADLLILDEVLDGADQFFKEKIRKRMEEIIKKSSSVIIVSHSIEDISKLCTKVIIMDKGKIIYNGNTKKGCLLYKLGE